MVVTIAKTTLPYRYSMFFNVIFILFLCYFYVVIKVILQLGKFRVVGGGGCGGGGVVVTIAKTT